ncbi:4Fe-4S ferredoxin [Hydrogenophaga taeniospiralis CCUG 15921]|uniref:4Fe-4S ferredoxin n=1 Tax=Hydrogenophaga taeniospiralis CCUG 15921 TaxID=1281780 RepID=A0A9X4NS03_9BURK|nr:4Fe-4S ferredoxin [Hydrogenophaga taeniospiralis CCUG 15921]
MQVCPVSCIPVNPQHVESRETLWQKYQRLQKAGQPLSAAGNPPASGT